MKLFISYSRKSRLQTDQFIAVLRRGGQTIWVDDQIAVGTDWQQQLHDAIADCDALVLGLTPDWLNSPYCQWEFVTGVELGKPIISVMLETTDLPRRINQHPYTNFTGGFMDDAQIEGFLDNLRVLAQPLVSQPGDVQTRDDAAARIQREIDATRTGDQPVPLSDRAGGTVTIPQIGHQENIYGAKPRKRTVLVVLSIAGALGLLSGICLTLALIGLLGARSNTQDATATAIAVLASATAKGGFTQVADQDTDGDGLSNEVEREMLLDPNSADTDGDGLSDGDEVRSYGTDPKRRDTDGDSLLDGDEVNGCTNPLEKDSDGDGVPDNQDPALCELPTGTATKIPTAEPPPTATTPPPIHTPTLTPIPPTMTGLPSATPTLVEASVTPRVTATNSPTPRSPLATDTPSLRLTQQMETAIALAATLLASPTDAPQVTSQIDASAIGNASVYPYYDANLANPETMRVELELILDEWFITPTPFGLPKIIAANMDIDRPTIIPDARILATPRPARDEIRVENIPPFVIAELRCLETSFRGCEKKPVVEINLRGKNRWDWTIQPIEDTSGSQDLTLLLFAADEEGNLTQNTPLWQYAFKVEVGKTQTIWDVLSENLIAIIVGVAVIGTVSMTVFITIRSHQKKAGETPPASQERRQSSSKVFVSYRRRTSWQTARNLHDSLSSLGADVFIDVDDLRSGDFGESLQKEIREREHFLVILTVGTFDSEWVVKETAYALQLEKNVLPILDGIELEAVEIPPELEVIRRFQMVKLDSDFYDARMRRIAEYVGL